jgi:hypothetical protein
VALQGNERKVDKKRAEKGGKCETGRNKEIKYERRYNEQEIHKMMSEEAIQIEYDFFCREPGWRSRYSD